MNADKALDMIAIFSTGFACGLEHRYECYYNYQQLLERYSPIEDLNSNIEDMWNVILEFEKGLASSPEEESELRFYTVEQLIKDIEDWYARDNKA